MIFDTWIEEIKEAFFDAITNDGTLDNLTDCAYSFLHNPIFLTNERGEIFSRAKGNVPYNDPLWEEFDRTGYVPREHRNMTSAEVYKENMRNNGIVIFEPAYISHRIMLFQCNVGESFVLRAIMLESQRPFNKNDEIVFKLFTNVAQFYLKNSELVNNFNSNTFEYFFHELLNGKIKTENNKEEIDEYIALQPGEELRLLIFDGPYGGDAPLNQYQMRRIIANTFKDVNVVLDEKKIVAVAKIPEKSQLFYKNLNRLKKILRENYYKCAISRNLSNAAEIATAYSQTKELLNDFEKYYRDDLPVGFDFYLPQYFLGRAGEMLEMDFMYEPVKKLDSFDGAIYVSTLYAYILCNRNLNKTAKLLNIHYNTAKYRIGKIEEILGKSIEDYPVAIWISLNILIKKNSDKYYECRIINERYHAEMRYEDYNE